jgi:hypothetical protein
MYQKFNTIKEFRGLILVLTALTGGLLQGFILGADDCQDPSGNDVFCISPATTKSCSGNATTCPGIASRDRKQFPDGVVFTDSGHTEDQQSECYKDTLCKWDPSTMTCVTDSTPSTWQQGDKKVVKDNNNCGS